MAQTYKRFFVIYAVISVKIVRIDANFCVNDAKSFKD